MLGNTATVIGFTALLLTLLIQHLQNSLTFRLFGVKFLS
ncbi:hypothetical protein F944_00304 [Acinetobacter ursingii DSM 16037 = CIP 107286]|nr:hypothetical protein F944_00304 [Acinetobacter ursingii DSM 16037 = CIP 107286]